MSEENEGAPKLVNRRGVLKLVGIGAAAGALPLTANSAQEAMHDMHHEPPKSEPKGDSDADLAPVYQFLNGDEAAFVEAAVNTFIPSDDAGPGALELGVAVFIDRQMNSGYGRGDRMYLQGPFIEGTPEQGYQLRMTPSELFRAGILDVNAYTQAKYKSTFDGLSEEDRVTVLTQLERREIALPTVPTMYFFNLLLDLTMQGYFADPQYGGNKDKASWKMIGFPGVGVMYADKIEAYRNKKYMSGPLSIQDLL